MSVTVSIRRAKHSGAPVYLGQFDGADEFSANPDRIVRWMCAGYRFRFNQHRALRLTPEWEDDPAGSGRRMIRRDEQGKPFLRTLGTNPVKLTDAQARKAHPHLAALPMQVLQHPERVENTEWWAALKRKGTLRAKRKPAGAMPRFRSAKRGDLRFGIWHNGGKNANLHRTGRRSGVLVITGMNPADHRQAGAGARWKLTITVRLSCEVPADYTSVQVDWVSKRITFVCPAPQRQDPATSACVGVDRGVAKTLALSDGSFMQMPDTSTAQAARKRHQQSMARSRRVNGPRSSSARYREHRRLAAKHGRHIANVRREFAHQASNALVRDHALIAFEDLDVAVMTRSARGTASAPGFGVRAKSGLNRSILASAWGKTLELTTDKASRSPGRHVVLVDPKNTSRTCSQCGHTGKENRESQAVFRCQGCGHTQNADTNAARNILARALQGRTGPAGRLGQTDDGEAVTAPADEPRTPALA